jgi:hypothetical protein
LIEDLPPISELLARLRREYIEACAVPQHGWSS